MESIVQKAKKGEIRALEELIHIYEIKLYKTARAILTCDDDINEAIQQTIILIYENINQLKNNKYFSTWMMKILINQCKKIWNQNNKMYQETVQIDDSIIDYEKEDYSFVNIALDKLDQEFKEVAVLYYYDEFSIKQILKILNIPQGTVKSRLSRAREKLKNLIKEEGL